MHELGIRHPRCCNIYCRSLYIGVIFVIFFVVLSIGEEGFSNMSVCYSWIFSEIYKFAMQSICEKNSEIYNITKIIWLDLTCTVNNNPISQGFFLAYLFYRWYLVIMIVEIILDSDSLSSLTHCKFAVIYFSQVLTKSHWNSQFHEYGSWSQNLGKNPCLKTWQYWTLGANSSLIFNARLFLSISPVYLDGSGQHTESKFLAGS